MHTIHAHRRTVRSSSAYVFARTDVAIEKLVQMRAHIEETLAELKVINASCRQQVELRLKTTNINQKRL